jgi:hypothetical protein
MRFMVLEIGIGDGSSLMPVQGEPSLFMEDDASVTFLYPLFEKLAEETGELIDPYGNAAFVGERLAALKRMLAEARRLAEAQPEHWQVCVGRNQLEEFWEPQHRETLLNLIAAWERVVARAEELGRPVVCFGD